MAPTSRVSPRAALCASLCAALCLARGLVGCGGDDAGPADAGPADAGRSDGGSADAGLSDAGLSDAGLSDAGLSDAGDAPRARLTYVAVGGQARLAVVELGPDGALSARAALDLALPGNPGAMAYARGVRRLYVGVRPGSIATVTLDAAGAPSLAGRTDGTGDPVYLALARGGSLLVSAYFGDDLLRVHEVVGAPPHRQLGMVATADEPHATRIGPTGARVYVPSRNGNQIQTFALGADGAPSLEGGVSGARMAGPRHVDFSPDGAFAYVINEYADSITTYEVQADGGLFPLQTLSTLPAGVDGATNTCADVHVTPDGRYVIGSNRGHDSLATFARLADGLLEALGHTATEARPREFDVSPDGRFVVAAGQGSGHLASYRIEPDGALTPIGRLDVGPDLRWVVID